MQLNFPIPAISLALLLFAGGCASTPPASPGRDAAAKEFPTDAGTAALYVYRGIWPRLFEDSVLYVDDRLIGQTLPMTFFRVEVAPGRHVLRGIGHDNGRLELETRPGERYFVVLNPVGGYSSFALVDDETGRRAVSRCCALLENWAPGQQRLLR